MKKQAGFTLIELIMVIVILGVLAAFALPRFADLGDDAREASIQGLAGALRSAANIAHAEQLAEGSAADDDVTLEGQAITMVDGYPTADAAGITLAAQVDTVNDYNVAGGGANAGDAITYSLRANCQAVYTAANGGAPTVVITTNGC